MARIRTRISVAGINDADITEGMLYFRQYLRERPWFIEPKAEWNPQENRLLVTVETEGDDPKLGGTAGGMSWPKVMSRYLTIACRQPPSASLRSLLKDDAAKL